MTLEIKVNGILNYHSLRHETLLSVLSGVPLHQRNISPHKKYEALESDFSVKVWSLNVIMSDQNGRAV
jgi:hypothetical protein